MESFFLNDKVNSNGIYAVNFYTLGVPHTVIVDDYLPLYKEDNGSFTAQAAYLGTDGSLWPPILEKAFAKYYGNYVHLVGGAPQMAIKTLNGAPVKYVEHSDATEAKIWEEMLAAEKRGDMMTAGSLDRPSGKYVRSQANGICFFHAYTVLKPIEVTDAKGKKIKLIKMRNPWGAEDYTGPYSDNSKLWTDALKKQVGGLTVNKKDGIFYIPLDHDKKSFVETQVSYDTSKMSRSHFLVLDDTKKHTRKSESCKGTCSYHQFHIKSATTQKVHLKVTTW